MSNLNRIKLPSNLDDITLKAVEKAEKENKSKKNRNKIIAASIAGLLIAGGAMNNEAVSAAIKEISNKIESVYKKGYGADLESSELAEYKMVIGKTVDDKGVKITLNEFYMDEETIYVHTTDDLKSINENSDGQTKMKFYINGKQIEAEPSEGSRDWVTINEDGTTDVLLRYKINKISLSEVEDVRISLDEVECIPKALDKNNKEFKYFTSELNTEEGLKKISKMLEDGTIKPAEGIDGINIKGKWDFKFKYDGKKVASQIKKIDINKSGSIENSTFTIKDIVITPLKIVINYDKKGEIEDKLFTLAIKDKNGKILDHSKYITTHSRTSKDGSVKDEFMLKTEDLDKVEIIPGIITKENKNGVIGYGKPVYNEKNSIKVKLK